MKSLLLNLTAAGIMLALFIITHVFLPAKKKGLHLVLALALLASCSKSTIENRAPEPASKATVRLFSTNAVVATKVITAKVNGVEYGRIAYSAGAPACGASGFGSVQIVPGTYTVDVIDATNPYATRQITIVVPKDFTTCVFFNVK